MGKTKIVVLYQVVMHYRVPLYLRLAQDSELDFILFYGDGELNTKLKNADFPTDIIKSKKHFTIRLPFKTSNHSSSLPFYPFLFFNLIRLSPDVIVSEGTSSFLNAAIAFLYAKIFRKKFIWWSLGKLKNHKNKGFRKIIAYWERYIERKSDAIFTYSTQGKEYFISEGVPPEQIFVGINVLETTKKLKEVAQYAHTEFGYNNYFNLVFIGSITKEKKLEVLIDALNIFNEKYADVGKLHIIGDGQHLDALKNYTDQKGLATAVVYHGRINEGASRILQHCDVMVLPGLGGLAICEGMVNSLPVITGLADGTENDLINDDCGFILPNINADILYQKLEYLYTHPEIRKKMGLVSFHRITKEFTFDKYYAALGHAINYSIKK